MITKWPSILQFRQVVAAVKWKAQYTGKHVNDVPVMNRDAVMPTLSFTGTVKLHGANGAVGFLISEEKALGAMWSQSRETVLDTETTNNGFYQFAKDRESVFTRLANKALQSMEVPEGIDPRLMVYGEWCGKGVQQKCAIHQLDKMFVIFRVGIAYNKPEIPDTQFKWCNDADTLAWITELDTKPLRIFHSHQFETYTKEFNFEEAAKVLEETQAITAAVEKQCPVAATFGATGIGEGVVWICTTPGWEDSAFWFKIKGEEHKVSTFKESVEVDPALAQSISEFVDATVTTARLEQGLSVLQEKGLVISLDVLGEFLKWITLDILKEEKDLIEASGVDQKKLTKGITAVAKPWFMAQIKPL